MHLKAFLIYLFFLCLIFCEVKGQTVVGMGTDNPNPNAVLELVSENQNQGFLVPRLSTQQRNASSFISKLTDQDNGLMVFDIDEGNFYYWYAGMWRLGNGTNNMTPKSTVWYVGDVIPANSQGENGDFYVHQPSSDLYRKQNGTFILIGSLKKAETLYSAGNGISITPQNEIINTGDLDTANELQDLSLSGTTLSLSGSNSTVDLSVLQDGIGTDSQHLSSSKAGNDVSISIDNGNTATFSVADSDNDDTNELQNLADVLRKGSDADGKVISNLAEPRLSQDAATKNYVDTKVSSLPLYTAGSGITINGSHEIINAAPDQIVILTGSGAVSVTGTYPNFTISATDNVNDADADPGNELQDLSMVLSRGASAGNQKIANLAAPVDAADAATKSYVDGLHASDADQSSTNEIQDLQLSSHTLKITNNASATSVDLTPYLDNTDSQTLSLSGNTLNITNGNAVDLSSINTDEQELSLNGTALGLSGSSTTVDLSSINTDVQMLSITGNSLSIERGNTIDLSGINTDQQDLSLVGNTFTLTGDATQVNLSATTPSDGEVLKWNAAQSRWEARSDVNTTYSAGSGVSINGSHQITNTAPDQTVTLNGTGAVSISGSYPNFTISATDHVNDADADATNEIQDLSLSGTALGLSGSGTTVDLSSINTDSQHLSSSKTGNDVSISIDNGNTTTFSVADNDDDAHNEKITSASLTAGDILRIEEAGTSHDIDMSGFQKKALPENQILVGNAANVATPVNISGDITLNSDGTMTITLDAVTTEKIINNAITTAKIANAAVTKDKINADVAGNGIGQNADGSLEINVAGGGLQITTDQLQLANKGDGQILLGNGTQVNARTISGDVTLANTGAATVTGLQGRPVSTTVPSNNQVLAWNGSAWIPQTQASAGNGTWYSGSTVPNASLPSGADDGNYYYHTGTQVVYRKESGTWIELGKWILPSGGQVSGATITSTTTPTLYIGTGSPTNGTTNNAQPGDFYFDTSDGAKGKLYIKKNNNDWHNF